MERRAEKEAIASRVGKVAFIAWSLLLGPIGALGLAGMAYSMLSQNLVLGILCGALIGVPFLSGLAWAIVVGFTVVRDALPRGERRAVVAPAANAA